VSVLQTSLEEAGAAGSQRWLRLDGPGSQAATPVLESDPMKPPFQFYVNDWLGSNNTAMMSPTQRGCYIQLLARSWPDGIDVSGNAREMLWALAGMPDASSWDEISGLVLAQFEERDGCLINAKLDDQFKQMSSYHRMQSDKARKGAHARWHKSGTSQAMPDDASSSSSSSSTSTAREEEIDAPRGAMKSKSIEPTPEPRYQLVPSKPSDYPDPFKEKP
jgi:uncharacterized protein YdaU (DUF1376 family)